MDHYEGTFEYRRLQDPDLNQFVLRFRSAHQAEIIDEKVSTMGKGGPLHDARSTEDS